MQNDFKKEMDKQPQDFEMPNEEAPNKEAPKKEKPKMDVKKEIISWVLTIGVAVVAALIIRTFLFEPVRVDGQSMADTLQNGEVMFVTKPEYLLGAPEVGDVVICKYPNRKERFVKRVMGVPGDELMIISNIVFRNGQMVSEPYLTANRNDDGFSMAPYKLGEGEYFVMGDNRDNSHDCRNMKGYYAPEAITKNMIIGKVHFVVFPFGNIRGIE